MTSVNGRGLVASGVALVLLASACGTRLTRAEILAQNGLSPQGGSVVATGTGASPGAAGTEERAAGEEAQALATGTGSGALSGGASGSAGSGDRASRVGPVAGGGNEGNPSSAGAKAPLVVGVVGWFSGVGGLTASRIRDTIGAWARAVNARGGVAGHPVQLLVADDGGNESRSVAIVRDFVENKKAVALLGYAGGSAVAVSNYARTRRVPIVGGLVIEPVWTTNPMMFPTIASLDGHFFGVANVALRRGIRKVGTVYCGDVPACQQNNDAFVRGAKAVGIEVVYQGRISFAQPDFTAECLNARGAGAIGMVPITENASAVRFAKSCARQNYRPTWLLPTAANATAQVPEFEGALAVLAGFPWFLTTGSPALEEYGAALRTYAPHLLEDNSDFGSAGWTAGKLFELAARNVSNNPTSAEILEGLWRIRGETLGGLTPPLSFERDRPAGGSWLSCVYVAQVKNGAWTAPQGMEPVCR